MIKIISTFELEKELLGKEFDFVVGIDEVGRGPLAGPVVAAAAMVKRNDFLNLSAKEESPEAKSWDLVRDSKTLSEKQRDEVYDFISEHFHLGIGICDHETIDRVNILQASFLAMKKALSQIRASMSREHDNLDDRLAVILDGNSKIPNLSLKQMAIPKGDGKVKSISAASIVAKVTRDRMMQELHKKYPQYGFDRHKGYGTKVHMDALREFGPCEIHRKSFKPVKRYSIA